jgi:hypothetical protein
MMLLPSCLLGMTEVALPISASNFAKRRLAQASAAACDSFEEFVGYPLAPPHSRQRAYEGAHLSPRMA